MKSKGLELIETVCKMVSEIPENRINLEKSTWTIDRKVIDVSPRNHMAIYKEYMPSGEVSLDIHIVYNDEVRRTIKTCCTAMRIEHRFGTITVNKAGFVKMGDYVIKHCPHCGKKIEVEVE